MKPPQDALLKGEILRSLAGQNKHLRASLQTTLSHGAEHVARNKMKKSRYRSTALAPIEAGDWVVEMTSLFVRETTLDTINYL
jgi:hypothetical protein